MTRFLGRTAVTAAAAAVLGIASLAVPGQAATPTIQMKPLPGNRTAVVVKWQPRSKTLVVVTPTGRMMTLHGLRRTRVGTRVRIEGIKWGAPLAGVKWGLQPRGVEWGIKWAINGTYSAKLRTIGRVSRTRVRGIVIARNQRAIAVTAPGGVLIVRMAVWLPPTTKSLNGEIAPKLGEVVDINANVDANGLLQGSGIRIEGSAARHIPLTGTVSAISNATGHVNLSVSRDPILPVSFNLQLPAPVLKTLKVGDEVTATVVLDDLGQLVVKTIGPAAGFNAANDPARQLTVPPIVPAATLTAIETVSTELQASAAAISDPAVVSQGAALVAETRARAEAGDIPGALASMTTFANLVKTGRDAGTVPNGVAVRLIALANDARTRLGATTPITLPAPQATMSAISGVSTLFQAAVSAGEIADGVLIGQATTLVDQSRTRAETGDTAGALASMTGFAILIRDGRDALKVPDIVASQLVTAANDARTALGATSPVLLPASPATLAQFQTLRDLWNSYLDPLDPPVEVSDPTFIAQGTGLLDEAQAAAIMGDVQQAVAKLQAFRTLVVDAPTSIIAPNFANMLRNETDRTLRQIGA